MKMKPGIPRRILLCTLLLLTSLARAETYDLPDGQSIEKQKGQLPYCTSGCDVASDCRSQGNAKPGFEWKCENKPKVCTGTCYQVPIKTQ